jgi:vacuolar protein sorting-associated protein 35
MDCIIQVFPDDFHLNTLELLLQTVSTLKEKVNVRAILEALMDRLAAHAANNAAAGAVGAEINSFKLFNDCISTLIEDRANMSLTETLRLQTVLTNFALKCHPSRIDYVAHCLSTSGLLIEKTDFVATSAAESQQEGRSTNETTTQIEALLSAPLSTLALRVLEIPSYVKLMSYLPWGNWKEVASTLLKSVISSSSPLSEVVQVEQLFKTITPLLRDKDVNAAAHDERETMVAPPPPSAQFCADQWLVARTPHLMKNDDTDTLLQMLVVARTHFTGGGSKRMQFTFPSLVFAALQLARRVQARERAVERGEDASPPQYSTRKVFHFIIEAITALAASHPEPAFNLFLQAAQVRDCE